MRSIGTVAETTSVTLPTQDGRAAFSWGLVYLMLFTIVTVGRIHEVIPALIPFRIGLVTGSLVLLAWVLASDSFMDKIPVKITQVRYVLILMGLGVATIPVGVWPGNSFEFVTQNYWKTVLLFLLVIFWCRSLHDVRRMVWVCCIGMVLGQMIGQLTGGVTHLMPDDGMNRGRINGNYGSYDANDVAMLQVMALPMVLYLFQTAGFRARLVLIGVTFASLYGLVLTQSRGGFLAFVVVCGLILWRSTLSRATKILAAGMVVLVFVGLAGTGYWDRMETMLNPQTDYDRTVGGRTEIWKTGLILMVTHPWGVGIDGFVTAEGLSHGGSGRWRAPHNSFLQVGVDLGIAGLAVFVMMFVQTFKELRRVQAMAPVVSEPAPALQRKNTAHPPMPLFGEKKGGEGDFLKNVTLLASALEISLWGFVAGSFFLSHAYSGVLYTLIGLSVSCVRLTTTQLRQDTNQGVRLREQFPL